MKSAVPVFAEVAALLKKNSFRIVEEDLKRPWGGFYVIDELQADAFAAHFFPDEKLVDLKITGKLSPKILMVAPGKRLSWQYHRRRAEIWRCIKGEVAVFTSDTDHESERHSLQPGEVIRLQKGKRHRLIGLQG